jgi:dihydrofolate reductase
VTILVCELILTLDGWARGKRSPGFYGYSGPEFDAWLKSNDTTPHRNLLGRRTYEMLNELPTEARDESYERMTTTPGWVFSTTLEAVDWSGLSVVHDDPVGFVRTLKQESGLEVRTVGSLSLVRQLLMAGLVDRLKLTVCPLILPQTGDEAMFEGLPDMGFDLVSSTVLDGRVLVLEYRPTGAPPYGDQ